MPGEQILLLHVTYRAHRAVDLTGKSMVPLPMVSQTMPTVHCDKKK